MSTSRRYYRCLKVKDSKAKIDVWHCSHDCMKLLLKAYDFVLPLDKKPPNVEHIKEG